MIRQAVLLLGGRGTRLWPLTDERPKGLLPLAGLPFVEYQLRLLVEAGVEEVVLAVGKEHEGAWRSFVADRGDEPVLRLTVEEVPLDTAGQVVRLVSDGTEAEVPLDERFLVLNGDVLFEAPLGDLVAQAPDDVEGVLVLTRVEDPSPFGVVVVGTDGLVERFVEKPPPGTAPADTVSAGIYLLRRRGLARFGPGPVSFERRVFPDLVAEQRLGAVVAEGSWLDSGTPELYLAAHRLVLEGGSRLHRPEGPHHRAEGAVVAGEQEGSWSWVGPGAVVEQGARVSEAVLLDGVRLHSGARVEGALVGWGSQILPDVIVRGQAIVGEGCRIGPECELDLGVRVAPGTELGLRAVSFSPPS